MESNNYNAAETPVETAPALSMKWHKFLTNFSLWLSALTCLITAYLYFSGSLYGLPASEVQWLYRYYEGLQALDIFFGVICVLTGVFVIVTRFALARYKAVGPKFLIALYIINQVPNLLYPFLASVITEFPLGDLIDPNLVSSLIASVVIIFVNKKYYARRAHLFVN